MTRVAVVRVTAISQAYPIGFRVHRCGVLSQAAVQDAQSSRSEMEEQAAASEMRKCCQVGKGLVEGAYKSEKDSCVLQQRALGRCSCGEDPLRDGHRVRC